MQRREEILYILNRKGQIEYTQLAEQFGVSVMTMRRDIEKLEQEGKAHRVHGGAVAGEQTWKPETITQKSVKNIEAKQKLAKSILQIIHPNSSIFLDAGSTTFEIASTLSRDFLDTLTIGTSDLRIAELLAAEERFQVYILGGSVDSSTTSASGHFAINMLQGLHAELAIIGCDAVTVQDGAMSAKISQVQLKQAMMSRSLQSALVADSSKLGRISLASIAPLNDFDYLVSEKALDAETTKFLEDLAVEVLF